MGTVNYAPRHSSLPLLNWLGGRVPKAYLRIERSRSQLAAATRAIPVEDEENVLSSEETVREANAEAERSASDTDIFIHKGKGSSVADEVIANIDGQSDLDPRQALESLSIDALRELACALQVHDRSKITEKEELIEQICKRL